MPRLRQVTSFKLGMLVRLIATSSATQAPSTLADIRPDSANHHQALPWAALVALGEVRITRMHRRHGLQ